MSAVPAQAGLIGVEIAGTDCSGLAGSPFDNCDIINLVSDPLNIPGDVTSISPSMIKFNGDGSVDEINSLFDVADGGTLDGSEWLFTPALAGQTSGSWTYTRDDIADPAVRFWVAKYANLFKLFYEVPDSLDAACVGNGLTYGCLSAALEVDSGMWDTNMAQQGLSHITFYDGGEAVPEPGTIFLLLLGVSGLLARRPRSS